MSPRIMNRNLGSQVPQKKMLHDHQENHPSNRPNSSLTRYMVRITERVRRHLRNPDSQHRQIALGFVWVSMFVFVGKLASTAKEMAIAWKYGVSETVDAYVFVINLVTLPVAIWFSVLTVVLVPFVARIRNTDPNALPQFRGELLGLTLAVGTGMGCFAYFGLPMLLRTGISGFSRL